MILRSLLTLIILWVYELQNHALGFQLPGSLATFSLRTQRLDFREQQVVTWRLKESYHLFSWLVCSMSCCCSPSKVKVAAPRATVKEKSCWTYWFLADNHWNKALRWAKVSSKTIVSREALVRNYPPKKCKFDKAEAICKIAVISQYSTFLELVGTTSAFLNEKTCPCLKKEVQMILTSFLLRWWVEAEENATWALFGFLPHS